jgi:hypothetical protein
LPLRGTSFPSPVNKSWLGVCVEDLKCTALIWSIKKAGIIFLIGTCCTVAIRIMLKNARMIVIATLADRGSITKFVPNFLLSDMSLALTGNHYEVETENLPYIRKIGNILRDEDSIYSEGF